jgi:hypothetical protein
MPTHETYRDTANGRCTSPERLTKKGLWQGVVKKLFAPGDGTPRGAGYCGGGT